MPVDLRPTATRHARLAPSDRLGRVLRHLRWPVLLGWILAIVFLHPLAGTLYRVTNDLPAANLPASAQSTQVAALQQPARTDPVDQTRDDVLAVVFARDGGITPADLVTVADTRTAVARLAGRVGGLGTPGAVRRSPDGRAVVFTVTVTGPVLTETAIDTAAVRAVRAAISASTADVRDGLRTSVTGAAAITADAGSTGQTTLLLTALVIVAIILLIVYRSVVLWIFPLLGALGGIVIAQAAAHGLGDAGLTVSSLSTSILIVLAFGAASDYALLLIHRYRDELRRHASVEDAMAEALRRTVPTLAASAATVVGAMCCLLAAKSASLHGLGPVGAVSIVAALLAQTTFLPAMLLIVGRAAFWPRRPHHGEPANEESRFWSGIGTRVARRPGTVAIGSIVLLGAACVGLVTLRVDNDPLANLKGGPESIAGAHLFADHFGPGAIAPLAVLAPPAEATAAATTARSTPDVAAVATSAPVRGYTGYAVTLSVDPYGADGSSTVAALRHRLDRDAPGSLVGGDAAIQYDISRAAHRDTVVLVPLVLVVIFLVVAVLLRALVASIVLVATTALSFGASFGLSNLVWHVVLGYTGIKAQIPLYVFVFLVALGVDYNIFLSARVREEAHNIGTRRGTLRGLSVTGGVITAAGLVLAGTFAALAQRPVVDLTEVGTAIAIGVLLDTLLVRTVLVPAAFLTIGDRVWWPGRSGDSHPGQ